MRKFAVDRKFKNLASQPKLLLKISAELNSSTTLNEVINTSIRLIKKYLNLNPGIVLLNEKENMFQNSSDMTVFETAAKYSIQSHPSILNDSNSFRSATTYRLPFFYKGQVMGMLTVSGGDNRKLSREEKSILRGIANLLGIAVKNARVYEKLKNLSRIDGLTQTFNYCSFQHCLDDIILRSQHQNLTFSLILLDIDNYRYYNDVFGHQKGDKVLKQIAKIIKQNVRAGDCVFRYSGDEFVIILPNTDSEMAYNISERIRKAIKKLTFEGEDSLPNGNITVSVGISTYPTHTLNKHKLLQLADEALYKAKTSSQKKIEVYKYFFTDDDITGNHLPKDFKQKIETMLSILNTKDRYTYAHTQRVVELSTMLAEKMGLSENQINTIKYGAMLHDIGKIEIDRSILNKRERLTEDEWNILKQHPVWGAEIAESISSIKASLPAIMFHHERWDGTGYPNGLKGEGIPLEARIICITGSFDAMTSHRPYRNALTTDQALLELNRCRAAQFDPYLLDHFIPIIKNQK